MANILTPKFRASYPSLLRPKMNDMNGKEEFSVVALFSKATVQTPEFQALKKAAQDAIVAKWGNDQKKWPKNLRSPFRKHEEKMTETEDGRKVLPQGMEEGGIFINLKSSQKPGVVDQNVQDILSESDLYAGCYLRATVRPFAYDAKGNCGVSFGLQNVQKVGEGDPLGNRSKPQDDFAPIEGAGQASDSGSGDNIFG